MHGIYEKRTIAIDGPAIPGVCQSVFMRLYCAKAAERIEVLLGVETLGDPKNITRAFRCPPRIRCGSPKLLCPLVRLLHGCV